GNVCSTEGKCVQCVTATDCGGGNKTCNNNVCEGPTACTDTETCNAADKKTYCSADDTAAGCQTATNCTDADVAAKGDNSAWETKIAQGKGTILYDVTSRRLTSNTCIDANGDPIKDETVEITYFFYNDAARSCLNRNCHHTHKGFKDSAAVSGAPARTQGTSSSKSGSVTFTMCFKTNNSDKHSFWVTDRDDEPSNTRCYTPGAN
ncbi:MAG: hypothetical protein AAGJ35_08425, partial [Myxococcota bacterium]